MKKILVVAVSGLAVACLALGQAEGGDASVRDGNVMRMRTRAERAGSSVLAATGVGAEMSSSTLTFITESLPEFTVGVNAQFQIEGSGGRPPYSFVITEGALPVALQLSKTGKITGIPKAEADTTIFVKLTDSANDSLTQAFAVRTAPAAYPAPKQKLKIPDRSPRPPRRPRRGTTER